MNDALRFTTESATWIAARFFIAGMLVATGIYEEDYRIRGRRLFFIFTNAAAVGFLGWALFDLIAANPVAGGG